MIIESFMFFGIGFLLAALSVLVVTPLVHGRAVRLTARRLEDRIPMTVAEVQADKDLQRADFAMSTRRLEINIEELRTKNARQLAEIGRKGDAINRLKTEVSMLGEQLRATEEEVALQTNVMRAAQRQLSEKEMGLAKLTSDLDKRTSFADAQNFEINRLRIEVTMLREQLRATEEKVAVKTRATSDAQRQLSEKELELARLTSTFGPGTVDAQKAEIIALKTRPEQRDNGAGDANGTGRFQSVTEHPTISFILGQWLGRRLNWIPRTGAPQRHTGNVVLPAVPKNWRTAELGNASMDAPRDWDHDDALRMGFMRTQPNCRVRENISSVPDDQRTAELRNVSSDFSQRNSLHDEGAPSVTTDTPTVGSVDCSQSALREERHDEGIRFAPKDRRPTAESRNMAGDTAQGSSNIPRHEGVPVVPAVKTDCSQTPHLNDWAHEGVPIGSKQLQTGEPGKVTSDSQHPAPSGRHDDGISFAPELPRDSSRSRAPPDQCYEGDILHFKSTISLKAKEANTAVGPYASEQDSGAARKTSDHSAGLRAVTPSIHVLPRPSSLASDEFTSNRLSFGRQTLRAIARVSALALIGLGALSAWQSLGNQVMEEVGNLVASLDSSLSASTTPSHATFPESIRGLEAMPHELAVLQKSVEQLTEKQIQMAKNIATLHATEQNIKKKTQLSHLQRREKLTAWPETRPTTIPGWTLRGITNGTAILEGPNGVWRAMRGDTVPGVGRVESMVRWGNRLIVATSTGLISTAQ
jgi:hypothetical protein